MPYRLTYNDRLYIQCDVCGKVYPQLLADDFATPLPLGWGGGPSHVRCPQCQVAWPKVNEHGYGWKAGTPVPVIDHWTGARLGPVFPGEPPEHYPLGYFRSFGSAQVPYFSRKAKVQLLGHWISSAERVLATLSRYDRPVQERRIARWRQEFDALLAEIAADTRP